MSVQFLHPQKLDTTKPHTTGTDRVLVWDGWRGMAILLVLCGHFYDIGWVWEDRMGVDVFFVLSGMLMSVILFEKRLSLRDFYIRRFSRIYPVFLVCVLVTFAIGKLLSADFSFSEVIASLTFMRTYLPPEPGIWASDVTVAHLWSLNVEEHAYVFLSLLSLAIINRRYVAVGLLCAWFGLLMLGFYNYQQLPESEFRLYLIRTESAILFILFSAGYGLLSRQYQLSVPSVLPIICLLLALLCYAQAAPLWLIFAICPVLLAVAVNHLHDLSASVKSVLSNPVLRQFGLWSYSIYLWQQLYFENAWRVPGGRLTAMVLAIITGAISYYVLEQPIRRIINKRWSANPRYRV